jgi:hypothetical protein
VIEVDPGSAVLARVTRALEAVRDAEFELAAQILDDLATDLVARVDDRTECP